MSTAGNQIAHYDEAAGNDGASQEPAARGDGLLPADGGNIDKIRDILFGGQMRDYERRFARLEERVAKEAADLRDDTRRRFETLEAFVRQELEALGERLQSEQRTRDEAVQNVSRTVDETRHALERKLAQADEESSRGRRDLRRQLLDQSKQLSDEIRQKHDELRAIIEREVAALGNDKTDRAALAGLFSEVALRLTNEFKIPGDR
jgi:chromosome segregation ATPase